MKSADRADATPSARRARLGRRLPIPVLIVVCFFALDGIERAVELVAAVSAHWDTAFTRGFFDRHMHRWLALLFDGLLATMLALGTKAGRFWAVIYLASVSGVGLALLVIEPVRWLEMGGADRVREIANHAVHLALVGILLSQTAAEALGD